MCISASFLTNALSAEPCFQVFALLAFTLQDFFLAHVSRHEHMSISIRCLVLLSCFVIVVLVLFLGLMKICLTL